MSQLDMEKIEQTIAALKQVTREAHEALKESRDERRKLEALKDDIKQLIAGATTEAIEFQIKDAAKIVMAFQEGCEEEVQKRFNELVTGPIADLEKLIRTLYKVHASNPMKILAENLPDNPLFQKMEKVQKQ